MKKLFTILFVSMAIAVQAQSLTVVSQWGERGNFHTSARSIVRAADRVVVSFDTEGDSVTPSLGLTDVRLRYLNPFTWVRDTTKVLAGAGNDFTDAPMQSIGTLIADTLRCVVRSWNGTLTSIGLQGPFGPYIQPRVLQFVNGTLTHSFKPMCQWDMGLSFHGLASSGRSVWTLVQRPGPYAAPAVNGVPNADGWKSMALTKLSESLVPQSTWFYGNGFNNAQVDTSENPESFMVTPDGAHAVITGWAAPAQGGLWDAFGWVWIINLQDSTSHQLFFPSTFNLTDVDMLPGTKDIIVLGTGGHMDTTLNQMLPVSRVYRIDPFNPDTLTIMYDTVGVMYTSFATLPDTSVVFNKYNLETRQLGFDQVDLMAGSLRSTYTFPSSGVEEYLVDLTVDKSDSTILFAGYGLCPNGDTAYMTTFPVTYNTSVPYYSAIAGKIKFPIEIFPVSQPTALIENTSKTGIATMYQAGQVVSLPQGMIANVDIISPSGMVVGCSTNTTKFLVPNVSGMYFIHITADGHSSTKKIYVN